LTALDSLWSSKGSGVILAFGPHTTLELFDAPQAAFVDRMEVGRRVSGPVRLALWVQEVEAAAGVLQLAGTQVLSQPKRMPWGDCNAGVETPDGMQVTVFQVLKAYHYSDLVALSVAALFPIE
jgi:hypothetical protein